MQCFFSNLPLIWYNIVGCICGLIELTFFEGAKMNTEARQRTIRRWVTGISLLTVIALFTLLGFKVLWPLLRDFQDPEYFRTQVADKGFLGQMIMVGIFMLQIFFPFLPGEVFEVCAGYAFGAWAGTVLCLIGVTLSSSCIFLLVRRFGMKIVTLFFPMEKISQWTFMKNSKKRGLITFMLFLIPGTPKDLITYFMGLTPMNLPTFLLLTVPARLPSLLTSTLTGGMLGNESYLAALILYAVTLVLTLICVILYRRESKRQKQQPIYEGDNVFHD